MSERAAKVARGSVNVAGTGAGGGRRWRRSEADRVDLIPIPATADLEGVRTRR